LQHPTVTAVIPGCKSMEQIESNAQAADLHLVSEDHPQAVAIAADVATSTADVGRGGLRHGQSG
jgi:aryl-alcohol dehydrogenase-like predicted oxidoreductase